MPTRHPRDYDILTVLIDDVDVTGIAGQVELYQDIFAPVQSAALGMLDTQNQLMNLPIKAGSKVEVIIGTSGIFGDENQDLNDKKHYTFYVYKVDNVEMVKQDTYTYLVRCISEEYFLAQKARISKHYSGTPQNIAKKIMSDSGVGEIVDTSTDQNTYEVIIPNYSPFTAINWLTSFARPNHSGADFWFYQVDEGEFAFKSIEDMFTDDSGLELKQVIPNFKDKNSNEQADAYVNIEQYEFINQFDVLPGFQQGVLGSKIIAHDIINKKIVEKEYAYGEDSELDKQYSPFSSPLFEDSGQANIKFAALHHGLSDRGFTPNETFRTWMDSRRASVMKLETNRLLVDIPGHAGIWKYLGRMVRVQLPSHQDSDSDKFDKYLKGDYLVTAIRHVIGKSYVVHMELSKKRLDTEQ